MIDIHTHLIPHVDDGSMNIEDSIGILKKAKAAGFDAIVATPHYIEGSYDSNMYRNIELLEQIKNEAKNKNIDIKLYLGNEVFITENIVKLIKEKKISSINNSRYILMELPFNDEVYNLQNCIFNLMNSGYIPIIAHPERYAFVKKDPNALIEYINQGVLFQCNSGSFIGHYGKTAQKTAEILLKHNMVHFIATDTHNSKSDNYSELFEVKAILNKLVGKTYTDLLMNKNPLQAIDNEDIYVEEPIFYKKKGLFGF